MESERWDRRYAEGEALWDSHASDFLEQTVEGLKPGRAIDLACGQGRNAVWLAERGWQVTGVDFSRVGLEQAEQLARARGVEVEWTEADLREYRVEALAFDLVLIFYLQVPQQELRLMIANAAAGVRPGGSFLLVGHDISNLARGYGGPQNPDVLYRADEMAEFLKRQGLAVDRADCVERSVETQDGERTALDTLVRARR